MRDKPAGRLRLLVPRFAAGSVLSPKLAKYTRDYPDVVLDVTAADELLHLVKKLQCEGITVAFARVRDTVRDDMRLAGIEAIVGPENFYERITDGVREKRVKIP